ncbi:hypothetical protein BHU09_04165 [Tannerella sp. oral taxon 808]|nr:hypothetical protein BHU09_04165 [Tannerella sp. oral taxon 808]
MKQLLVYIFAFMLATAALHAQETIDTAQFWAVYKFSYKTAPEQPDFDWLDWMYLDVGDKATKFFNRYAEIKDSVKDEGLKKGLSAWELFDLTKEYPVRGAAPIYYQLYDERKTKVSTEYAVDGYTYEEPMEMPNWTLHEDTMTVLGYLCKRATTHFRGRDWEVYYAPEIQLSRGPWKLWGLPGLITRATDADHYFLFEIDLFKRLENPFPILYIHRKLGPKGGRKGDEYKVVSKETYMKYEASYHKDMSAFISFEIGSEIKDTEGNPMPVRELPYIPLEK